MFYVSTKKEPYYYKIQRIKKGTTTAGKEYTFIDISARDNRNNQFKNAELIVWEDVNAEVDDKIAILSISAFDYDYYEKGFKKYMRATACAERYDICKKEKSADDSTQAQYQTEKPNPKENVANNEKRAAPAPKQQPLPEATELTDEDSSWDDIPF